MPLVMGRNAIFEVLKSSPERIVEVYTSQRDKTDELFAALLKQKITIREMTKHELSQLVQSESHQSYVAKVKGKQELSLSGFLQETQEKETSLVVVLDSIFDPQNLGAIIRACECFGVDLIIFSKNRGSDITPVTTKTSAGATELVSILKVSNLVETVKALQKEGFWAVAAENKENAQSLYDFEFPEKTVLILGSEGKGIQPLLSKKCDFYISIPMLGRIDSLNVSQAAAVILSAYRQS